MGFYNGIPISVVGAMQSVSMPTDSMAQRRTEEDSRLSAGKASTLRLRQRMSRTVH
jgi:hypothetical protein